jgi:hypothetical protein
MFSTTWLKDAAERAVKTFAQALLALMGAAPLNIIDLNWGDMLGVSATATVVSVLTSVVSVGLGDKGTASAVKLDS